jgi:hypothetical protein
MHLFQVQRIWPEIRYPQWTQYGFAGDKGAGYKQISTSDIWILQIT